MRFLLMIGLAVLVVVGLAYGYGSSLPREHVVASQVTLSQPPEAVWAVVRDPSTLVGTWSDLTRSERAAVEGSREAWDQTIGTSSMRIMISEARPPVRLVTTVVADEEADFGGRWTYQLSPVPGGTQLTITEAGWIQSPLYRVMGRTFGLHGSIEGYLKAIGQHFNEGVRPVRVKP